MTKLPNTTIVDGPRTAFGVNVTAAVFTDPNNQNYVIYGVGYQDEIEGGTPEEMREAILVHQVPDVEASFAKYGLKFSGEWRTFKAEDEFKEEFEVQHSDPIFQLIGVTWAAMKVE